ncbi:MAG: beta-lactamase hydrolase domain-containing protein [Heteroscytonema crispum UTEX LB 1556]
MEIVRKINDELAIAGQISIEQLQQIAEEGYRSVLNLRSPDEKNLLDGEREKTQFLGLYYVNLPTKSEEINYQFALRLFAKISELPKPTLIHCDNCMRSAAIVLMYIATRQGIAFDKVFLQATNLGLI